MPRTDTRRRPVGSEKQIALELSSPAHTSLIREIRESLNVTANELARYLGSSLVSVVRWERGDTRPNSRALAQLQELKRQIDSGEHVDIGRGAGSHLFASRGARHLESADSAPKTTVVRFASAPYAGIATRLQADRLWGGSNRQLAELLADHSEEARTISRIVGGGISAGKNTYTYDAHTYHTKVPPQGIAEVLKNYLPDGGLILDPFSGSGMTGVAALTLGYDVVLNELSPAASFISNRFTQQCDPGKVTAAVQAVCARLRDLRQNLYATNCRECGEDAEILYTVWSYRVRCMTCDTKFTLWDHCRQYGRTVREHKILKEFPCPGCGLVLRKSRLPREETVPVLLGYKCCSRHQVEHPLNEQDLARVERIDRDPQLAEEFVPRTVLPNGVNLGQPRRHGLTTVDRFYTSRNLSALSNLWKEIHHLEDQQVAAFLAFVFTSLYQRVTKLSEFRFWGGSGNTANFNVPYIQNEANVFVTFERKARSIQDHLATTAQAYRGRALVHTGSATDLDFLPDASIDLVFTDPPFGANINYSEMNILWESWLGLYTDTTNEAIVNKVQGKDVARYGELMAASLRECYRVLRPGHWMVLVFMNSAEDVWESVRSSVTGAGFVIERVDIFDKQHGTFKQFVSENTAGCDLLLHCRKPKSAAKRRAKVNCQTASEGRLAVLQFLSARRGPVPKLPYLHVHRREDIDYRMLYSEFLAKHLVEGKTLLDFSSFRSAAAPLLEQ